MAVRAHTRFHQTGQRSLATLASVVAMLAWKLALEAIRRLRKADYTIEVGRQFFDMVCEFMVLFAVAADRVAYRELEADDRASFTTALVKRQAGMIGENDYMLLGEGCGEDLRQGFLDRFNRRNSDYAEFDYGAHGPDFGFRRYFASCLREILPEQEQLWVVDQAMDIEAPEALRVLEKTLVGLFHPESHESRRARVGAVSGE